DEERAEGAEHRREHVGDGDRRGETDEEAGDEAGEHARRQRHACIVSADAGSPRIARRVGIASATSVTASSGRREKRGVRTPLRTSDFGPAAYWLPRPRMPRPAFSVEGGTMFFDRR